MSRNIKFNSDARIALKKGVDKIAKTVNVTLGAKGRNVIIERDHSAPHITKDGVTVAREISLTDPIENMGAEMIKEAASKTVNEAGDGTTTTTVLAQAIIEHGMKLINKRNNPLSKLLRGRDVNPMDLKRGIDKGVKAVIEQLDLLTIKNETTEENLRSIATISANNDSVIGNIIAEALIKVSIEGSVRVEESKTTDTYVDVVKGAEFVNGLLAPQFLTNFSKGLCELENPLIFFYGKKVVTTKEILPIIELGLQSSRPVLLLANDFEGDVVATLIKNRREQGFLIIPVRAPSYADKRSNIMEDLSILTGGTFFSEEKGMDLSEFKMEDFGEADKVSISPERTTIIGGKGSKEELDKRVSSLRSRVLIAKEEIDEKDLRNRIAKLVGGVATIYVGANSEIEMNEKKDRVDDSLSAAKAAIAEGIVAGGGVTLLNCIPVLSSVKVSNRDQKLGVDILKKALKAPIVQIAENSGLNGNKVVKKVTKLGYPMGYNAKEDIYEDMLDAGIIDPKKVTRVALESAASVASLVLTTEATISNIKK